MTLTKSCLACLCIMINHVIFAGGITTRPPLVWIWTDSWLNPTQSRSRSWTHQQVGWIYTRFSVTPYVILISAVTPKGTYLRTAYASNKHTKNNALSLCCGLLQMSSENLLVIDHYWHHLSGGKGLSRKSNEKWLGAKRGQRPIFFRKILSLFIGGGRSALGSNQKGYPRGCPMFISCNTFLWGSVGTVIDLHSH